MHGHSDRDAAWTLVHEMVHLARFKFGNASRHGYHNKEWAASMEKIGWMPSHTGLPCGEKSASESIMISVDIAGKCPRCPREVSKSASNRRYVY